MKYITILVKSSYPTSQKHLILITKRGQVKECAKFDMGYPIAFSVQAETRRYVVKRGTCFMNNVC